MNNGSVRMLGWTPRMILTVIFCEWNKCSISILDADSRTYLHCIMLWYINEYYKYFWDSLRSAFLTLLINTMKELCWALTQLRLNIGITRALFVNFSLCVFELRCITPIFGKCHWKLQLHLPTMNMILSTQPVNSFWSFRRNKKIVPVISTPNLLVYLPGCKHGCTFTSKPQRGQTKEEEYESHKEPLYHYRSIYMLLDAFPHSKPYWYIQPHPIYTTTRYVAIVQYHAALFDGE